METGFVKLPRSLINEDWAGNPATLTVFVHLLMEANYEQREWQGHIIHRGAAVTSYRSLAESCGITPRQARTAIDKLCAQGYAHKAAHPARGKAAQDSAHPCTIVTFCNYDDYSGNGNNVRTPKRAPRNLNKAQQSAQQSAPPKEVFIEYKEICKEILGDDARFLQIVDDWLSYKKECGKPYKGRKGITQFCNLLKEYSQGDPETARRIVMKSMAANWGSIFPDGRTAPPRAGKTINNNPRIAIEAENPDEIISTI